MTTIHEAQSIEQVHECLRSLNQRHERAKDSLERLVEQKQLLTRVDVIQAKLAASQVTCRDLLSRLGSASSTAARIAGRVSALDVEQGRVKGCLATVEQVVELRTCALGIHRSMESQDWEGAATYIGRARQLPQGLVEGRFARSVVPTSEVPEDPEVMLQSASESLNGLFLREFESAAKQKDGERVTRYFKLFPLIGKQDTGLDVYGRWVSGLVGQLARQNMDAAASAKFAQHGIFSQLISWLFEHIASIVEGHNPLVEQNYGSGCMIRVFEKRLIGEVDRQGGIILDTWWDERGLAKKTNELRSYPFSFLLQSFLPTPSNRRPLSPSPNSVDQEIDLVGVDTLVNEMTLMLSRWGLFGVFSARLAETTTLPPMVLSSHLATKISSRLVPTYEASSTFFFRRSVEKAFQLCEFPQTGGESLITSVVDDVMYILKKTLSQTVSTGILAPTLSVIVNVRRVIEGDYVGMIARRLRDETVEHMRTFEILLNDLDTSYEYLSTIVDDTRSRLPSLFPFDTQAATVDNALQSFLASFRRRCTDLVTEGITLIFSSFKLRLRFIVDALSDDGAGEASEMRSRISAPWNNLMAPHKQLTSRNYEQLMEVTMAYVARMMEKKILNMAGKIDELGSIRLERDVAAAVSLLADGRYALRQRFQRPQTICALLNEETGEEQDDSSYRKLLSDGDIKRLRDIKAAFVPT